MLNYKKIQQILDYFFFWLPTGNNLTRKHHHFAVWVVLAALVFYTFSQSGTDESVVAQDNLTPQFSLTSRYCLGVKHLFETALQLSQKQELSEVSIDEVYGNLIREISSTRASNTDKVALAILIAEFFGKAPALDYLDSLGKETNQSTQIANDINFLKKLYSGQQAWDNNELGQHAVINRYHWLGELLQTQNLPGQTAKRSAIYARSTRTTLSIVGLLLLIGLTILTRLVIDIVTFLKKRHFAKGLAVLQPGPNAIRERVVLLESVVLFLGMVIVSSFVMRSFSVNIGLILYFCSVFSVLWPLYRGVGLFQLKNILGVNRGQGIAQEIKAGISIYIRCLPILLAGILLTFYLVEQSGKTPVHPIIYQFETGELVRLLKWGIIACIFAPIVEELVFRGVFYHYFRQRYSFWISSFVTSAIFAAIHPQGYAAIPSIMAIGISLSLMRELRYSIIAPVTAHVLNNSVVTIFLLIAL